MNEQRQRAYQLYGKAVRSGQLVRPERCEDCGNRNLAGQTLAGHHHNGYDDEHATDVVFLCNRCHSRRHRDDDNMRGRRAYEGWETRRRRAALRARVAVRSI